MSFRAMRKWYEGNNAAIINSGGAPVAPSPAIFQAGTTFFVDSDNGSDNADGLTPSTAKLTVAAGYDLMTSNANDVLYLSANAEHALTEMLDISKNRCHFVGTDFAGRSYGSRSRISSALSSGATNIATMQNTGIGNTFTGIKFDNGNTVAEGLYCVVEAGEYAMYNNCEIYKSTDLDVTGAAELVNNGDSAVFRNCTIGSNANAISGAIIRPNVLCTNGIVAGKVSRDVTFERCNFWRRSSNATNRFIYGANAADIQRMLLFNDCVFWNAKLSGGTPAQNVAFGASLSVGYVLLNNCISVGAATAMSTTTGVFVNGPNQTSAAGGAEIGIALQAG